LLEKDISPWGAVDPQIYGHHNTQHCQHFCSSVSTLSFLSSPFLYLFLSASLSLLSPFFSPLSFLHPSIFLYLFPPSLPPYLPLSLSPLSLPLHYTSFFLSFFIFPLLSPSLYLLLSLFSSLSFSTSPLFLIFHFPLLVIFI
jgi:hypothetical protein